MRKLTVNDPETRSADLIAANVEQLKVLFPEAFTEGKVDFAARAAVVEARWLALADAMTEGTLAAGEIVAALAGLLENDLEEASFGLFPSLVAAKQALFDEGASGCLMSGSGPTLYGVCESRATAAELCRRVQRRGLNARVARAGRLGDNPVLS